MLIENTLFGVVDKEKIAIERLRSFEPADGYYVAYSGGKDSDVILDLIKKSGVRFDAHYSVTSVDAPETIYYIRRVHPEVIWDFPKDQNGKSVTMWTLIPQKKIPPTRIMRYCCAELKESQGKGRITVTGVRWAESVRRRNTRRLVHIGDKKNQIVYNDDNDEARRMVEQCYRTRKTLVNPIIDWTDADVWEYIQKHELTYNPLYDIGYKRIGCLGCPVHTRAGEELERYPKIKKLYLRAFEKMLKQYDVPPKKWKTAQDVYDWWLGGGSTDRDGQTSLFD